MIIGKNAALRLGIQGSVQAEVGWLTGRCCGGNSRGLDDLLGWELINRIYGITLSVGHKVALRKMSFKIGELPRYLTLFQPFLVCKHIHLKFFSPLNHELLRSRGSRHSWLCTSSPISHHFIVQKNTLYTSPFVNFITLQVRIYFHSYMKKMRLTEVKILATSLAPRKC